MADFVNETKVGNSTSYCMVLEKSFKERPHNITVFDPRRFTMVTPVDCSITQWNSTLYIIYGDTDADGVLQTNKCNMELYNQGFFNDSVREGLMQIMWGIVNRTCRGDLG